MRREGRELRESLWGGMSLVERFRRGGGGEGGAAVPCKVGKRGGGSVCISARVCVRMREKKRKRREREEKERKEGMKKKSNSAK